LHPLRNQIVAIFFKILYARNADLVEAARAALNRVLTQQHKLPTELLQNGLRPVLQSLGEPRTLNLTAVEGLRRILELFAHFFRAEIGKKLLEYLTMWAKHKAVGTPSPANPEPAPTTPPSPSDTLVIVAIMELFVMLPPCGGLFMGDLVEVSVRLETDA
jgi:transformation/transcription domain-associated protein